MTHYINELAMGRLIYIYEKRPFVEKTPRKFKKTINWVIQ